MLSILKDKNTYSKIIIKALPLALVSVSAFTGLYVGIVSLLAVCLSSVAVCLLKPFISGKYAAIAKIIISVGVVGILTMTASLFMKKTVDSVALYLPLISLTTVLLIDTNEVLNASPLQALKNSALIGGLGADLLLTVGFLRELLGLGSFFGLDVYTKLFSPVTFFTTPAGALLLLGLLAIGYNLLATAIEKRCDK